MVAQGDGEWMTRMIEPGFQGQRDRDRQEMAALQRAREVNIKAILLTLAIVISPFVALLYSMNLALAVLALALGFTTWLTLHVADIAGPAHRSRMRAAAWLNGAMIVATLGILILRLTS